MSKIETSKISLYAWAKREEISYSYAQKLMERKEIGGAWRDDDGKTFVPVTTKKPILDDFVVCAICSKQFSQISSGHLAFHDITLDDYRNKYPSAKIVCSSVIERISDSKTGIRQTDQHKQNTSRGKRGLPLRYDTSKMSPDEKRKHFDKIIKEMK